MAEQAPLRLQVAASTQLFSREELERWVSDRPDVASVGDVDVVNGRPGGRVQALSPGRAVVRGIGPDGTVHLSIEVIVEGPSAIELAAGQTAALPAGEAPARCTTAQTQVVELREGGEVRALSPGIARVVCTRPGRPDGEFVVRVTGEIEVEAGGRLALGERFGVPVRQWRTGSSRIATVDADGTVTAGDEPRTTSVRVTLADGESFEFDLRVRRPAGAAPAERLAARPAPTPPVPPPPAPVPPAPRFGQAPPVEDARATSPEDSDAQRGEVAQHLFRFDDLLGQQRWADAKVFLRMADIAAGGFDDLQALVREAAARLDKAKRDQAACACAQIARAVRAGERELAEQLARDVPASAGAAQVPQAMLALAASLRDMEDVTVSDANRMRALARAAEDAWQVAAQQGFTPVLAELAEIAAEWGIEELAATLVAGIGSFADRDASIADRDRIIAAAAELGEPAIVALLERLIGAAGAGKQWVLYALCEIGMDKAGQTVAAFYARQGPPARERIGEQLLHLARQSPGDFVAVMAGGLQRLPKDRRLAEALVDRFGRDAAEQLALKLWTRSKARSARAVLEQIFQYRL